MSVNLPTKPNYFDDSRIYAKSHLWKNKYLLSLFLFSTAIVLKLFLFFTLSTPVFFSKYPFFADRINKGFDIGERLLDLSPLYLYAMAGLQRIYGSNWQAMIIFQLIAGSLNCIFIFLIGERVFNRTVGLIAALFLMLYGNLTLFEMTLEPDSFAVFLNTLFILIIFRVQEKSSPHRSALLWLWPGLILGLSIITKPNAFLFLPAFLVWILWIAPGNRKKFLPVLFFFLGISMTVLPITVRNYLTFHDPVLVTADMGKVFYHGNGPEATGLERADLPDQGFREENSREPDYAHALFRSTARRLSGRHLTPSECSEFWISRTLGYMKSRPWPSARLFFKKFILFWLNYEVQDLDTNYAYYQTMRHWPLMPFGLISTLGLVGMFINRKNYRMAYWPYVMVLGYLLTLVIFFDASRYRLPAVPFLCLFAATGLLYIKDLLRKKLFKKDYLIMGSILLLVLFTFFFLKREIDALDRWQQATRIYYNLEGNGSFKKGEYQKAIEAYKKAVALAPDFAPAYNQLGKSYALRNEPGKAEENFLKVIALSPNSDQGYMNLGFLYELRGDIPKATAFFLKAYSLNADNLKVKEQLKHLKNIKK
jgi:tetratricopeptide (TPR) repeat protein